MHHIRSANFRLKTFSEEIQPQMRADWQRWFESRLVPLLDRSLNRWLADKGFSPLDVIDVSRLNLNIGLLGRQLSDNEILDKLERQLYPQLNAQTQTAGTPAATSNHHNPTIAAYTRYIAFLRTGRWPLGGMFESLNQFETWLNEEADRKAELIQQMSAYSLSDPVWQRFLLQHSTLTLASVAQLFANISDDIEKRIAHIPGETPIRLQAICRILLGIKPVTGLSPAAMEQSIANAIDACSPPRVDNIVANLLQRLSQLNSLEGDNPFDKTAEDNDLAKELDKGLLVEQAGVVLLHPFLQSVFENIGCICDQSFGGEESQLLAIAALQYAATGNTHGDESSLTLHKWLVGWPITKPLPHDLPLSQNHKAEIDGMLQAAIGHWSALKNTSIDGLRETFLQRSGSLKSSDNGSTLYVEQRSVDILLQQLPWSLGLVAFPWLKQPLFVNWEAL